MASIYKEIPVEVTAEEAWSSLRLVGEPHKLFAPVLVDATLDGDTRTVRFANGMVVQERVLDVDDGKRRVAYTVLDGPGMTYHHAEMRIVEDGPGRCRFVWTTDFLPPEAGSTIAPLVEQGARTLKNTLEAVSGKRATA